MARAENAEIIDRFEEFYRDYYREAIGDLAGKYPTEQRSLYVDWNDIYRFDPDLADDFLAQPGQMREYAEEALRLFDLPVDVKLGQAHVRVHDLPEATEIRGIRSDHAGRLVAVRGIVRKATDVLPKIQQAAFECQRCGTLTRIPQTSGGFQEPHECQGCERQGPFEINFDQSEFEDYQKLRVQESPEGLRGGETPQSIDVNIADDITGKVTAGDHVKVTGVLHLEQQGSQQEKSPVFDFYMDGMTVEIEDEQFEDMDISDADKRDIVELSNRPDIYELMVDSLAPSLYGLDEEKLAIILQLFSGVAKKLPDESRIRGDLHLLLIGDPGTGKCVRGDTRVRLGDGREVPIKRLVERNLEEPIPVDDGVYDEVDIEVPSMAADGSITTRTASKVWKREAPARMYRVRTASGKEIEVTPSHPLFVQSAGRVESVRAAKLGVGEFIATPRTLPSWGEDTLDVDYRESKANNAVRLDLPDEFTPWLARFIGYVIAEGHITISDDHSADIRITNEDEEILADVGSAFERLGVNYTVDDSRESKAASVVRSSSSELASFLKTLEPAILKPSAAQRVPPAVMGASAETRREFLRAYADAECHVSAKQREITIASMSRDLLEGVESLLLGFEICASIESRHNGSYRLRIGGDDFDRYVNAVGFITERKANAAGEFDEVESNPNLDVVPRVGDELEAIRESLGLSQFECRIPRSTYQHYERGDRNPTRKSLNQVLNAFEDRLRWLTGTKERVQSGSWSEIETVRSELNLSQRDLAQHMGVEQTTVSYYERNEAVPDGGGTKAATNAVLDRIEEGTSVEDRVTHLRRLATSGIRWDRIESIERVEPDYDWVYDLEVEGTHSYVSNNVISHNSQLLQYVRNLAPRAVYTSGKGSSTAGLTAAAVRDDFGDSQQWTLEAGAMVLADKGVAAIDELDKMAADDRSALHEGLEQQSISISKAGINATLKSRCSLLGAANPKYGRFDQYESIGEQIDLEPALVSRFDLIFTVTDEPDPERDRDLADHIIRTNYAGELNTHRTESAASNVTDDEVEAVTESVEPAIETDLLRKYVAYAKRNCFPTMTDEAKEAIKEFYVDLRAEGADEDAPVPVTARKLEALVRLAEASARVRLSDTVEAEDADRVIDIVRACLRDIGVDPETGQFDADVVETGTSKSQRDRIRTIKGLIEDLEDDYEDGAPVEEVLERAETLEMERSKAEHEIEKLKRQGEVYEPRNDHLRTT